MFVVQAKIPADNQPILRLRLLELSVIIGLDLDQIGVTKPKE